MLDIFAVVASAGKGRIGTDAMARGIRATTRTTPVPKAAARSTAKPGAAKAKAPVSKTLAGKAPAERAPMVSKGELRAQLEKLERTNATLRAKSRAATRAAKTAAVRIAELEEEVARLEKRVASQAASAKRSAKQAGRSIDPGDAVPSGVAVAEPEPLDEEAEGALEKLEEHLGESSETDQSGERERAE
jgi:hypothetical protein